MWKRNLAITILDALRSSLRSWFFLKVIRAAGGRIAGTFCDPFSNSVVRVVCITGPLIFYVFYETLCYIFQNCLCNWRDDQNLETGTRILLIQGCQIALWPQERSYSIDDVPKIAVNCTESEKSYEQTMKLKTTKDTSPCPAKDGHWQCRTWTLKSGQFRFIWSVTNKEKEAQSRLSRVSSGSSNIRPKHCRPPAPRGTTEPLLGLAIQPTSQCTQDLDTQGVSSQAS